MRLAITMLTFALTASLAYAQEPKLPDGLRHVPLDALGFVHFRAGAFLKSEIGKQLLSEALQNRDASQSLKKMEQELGMPLGDIDTVTLLMLSPPSLQQMRQWDGPYRHYGGPPPMYDTRPQMPPPAVEIKKAVIEDRKPEDKKEPVKDSPVVFQDVERIQEMASYRQAPGEMYPFQAMEYLAMSGPLVIVTSTKDLDRKKILKTQFLSGARGFNEHHRHDHRYGGPELQRSVLFLGERTLMIGAPWELARYSEHMARNPGPKSKPLEAALTLAVKPHVVVVGGRLPAELRSFYFSGLIPDMRPFAPIAPLLQTEAAAALDLGKTLDLTLLFNAPTKASAETALQAAKTLRVMAELAIEKKNEEGEPGGWRLVLEKRLKQALAGAVIEQKGTTVRARLKMDLDPILVKHYTKEIIASMASRRTNGERLQSMNNLKVIGLGLHSFHDVNKRMPAAGVGGPMPNVIAPDGKPLLSWRVAILPYIDQAPLYNQFDFTQPWDHPTNKKLIALMPPIYLVPGAPETKEPGMTHYRVLVGPQTMFEPGVRVSFAQITDGLANTIMAVEAKEPIVWTKPDDLPYDPKQPLPKLGITPDSFLALFGDGVVRSLRLTTDEQTLRALITRNGGETASPPDEAGRDKLPPPREKAF